MVLLAADGVAVVEIALRLDYGHRGVWHDYKRNGVVDLYAALEVATGKGVHRVTSRQTGADFLAFLKQLARTYQDVHLHVIVDNSSTHSTLEVMQWRASWLNQVEGLFSILTRRSLRRTSFPSKAALRRHIADCLAGWNRHPTQMPDRLRTDTGPLGQLHSMSLGGQGIQRPRSATVEPVQLVCPSTQACVASATKSFAFPFPVLLGAGPVLLKVIPPSIDR